MAFQCVYLTGKNMIVVIQILEERVKNCYWHGFCKTTPLPHGDTLSIFEGKLNHSLTINHKNNEIRKN
jgi:hypothetical protein